MFFRFGGFRGEIVGLEGVKDELNDGEEYGKVVPEEDVPEEECKDGCSEEEMRYEESWVLKREWKILLRRKKYLVKKRLFFVRRIF